MIEKAKTCFIVQVIRLLTDSSDSLYLQVYNLLNLNYRSGTCYIGTLKHRFFKTNHFGILKFYGVK